MGSRSRQDPAEHIKRSKGAPTPKAPPAAEAPVELAGAPGCVHVVFAQEFRARIGEHPAIAGPILDMGFRIPGGSLTVRLPAQAWPAITAEVASLLEALPEFQAQQRAAASGLVVAGAGTNVAAEAAAHNAVKKGPSR